jgi:uncharacterized SAM-binding protein YcdF (DUF218 family)
LSRAVAGILLAKQFGIPVVFSGGSGDIAPGQAREADALADLAMRIGLPREQIKIEAVSRNTEENAALVRSLLPGDRIVLVTSAFHMRRASACFKKQGFMVLSAPTAYLTGARTPSLSNLLPRADHLSTSSLALSEYLSTTWYRVRGVI